MSELQTPEQKSKKVTVLLGNNDCLSADSDIKESITAYEKFLYASAHKFTAERSSICILLPLGAIRIESGVSVNKFNKQPGSLVSKVKDLSHTNPYLIDLNASFQNCRDYIHTDDLHPSENVVKAIAKSFRNNLIEINEISNSAISI